MTLNEKVYLLLVERSSELLLPFLDRYEVDKLARGKIYHDIDFLYSINCLVQ